MQEQLTRDFERFTLEVQDLRTAITVSRQRHEETICDTWTQAQSVCLAQRLEGDGLRRSLAFAKERLHTKIQEAAWWRDCAVRLNGALERAAAEKGAMTGSVSRPPSTLPQPAVPGRPHGVARSM